MIYYIQFEGESNDVFMFDASILGETSDFGNKFYPGGGFSRLVKLVNGPAELFSKAKILDEKRTEYTVEQFLTKINKHKIQQREN